MYKTAIVRLVFKRVGRLRLATAMPKEGSTISCSIKRQSMYPSPRKPLRRSMMRNLSIYCIILVAVPSSLRAESIGVEVSSSGDVDFVDTTNPSSSDDDAPALTVNATANADVAATPTKTLATPLSFLYDDEYDDEYDDDEDEDWDDEGDWDDDDDEESPGISPADDHLHSSSAFDHDIDDGSDIGVAQVYVKEHHDAILAKIEYARNYVEEDVMVDDFYAPVRKLCVNKHEECAHWAVLGECANNPGYMRTHCAPVCETCDMLHVSTRCPKPLPNATLAMYAGDLNRMFYRLLSDPAFAQYAPKAISRPDFADGDSPETAAYVLGMWVVVLENIVNPEEAHRMIELASEQGFERSSDVGIELEDGTFGIDVNDDRTSTNAWCEDDCYDDPVPQKVMNIIEHVTGIPKSNQESLQQLKYKETELYRTHNDFIDYQVDRPCGPRILTFFLYLNDVEEGGETNFPRIDITVKPKLGRAVLWPSVYDHNPLQNDIRSDHQALPVIKGLKYGANAWIHQGNVQNDELDCM